MDGLLRPACWLAGWLPSLHCTALHSLGVHTVRAIAFVLHVGHTHSHHPPVNRCCPHLTAHPAASAESDHIRLSRSKPLAPHCTRPTLFPPFIVLRQSCACCSSAVALRLFLSILAVASSIISLRRCIPSPSGTPPCLTCGISPGEPRVLGRNGKGRRKEKKEKFRETGKRRKEG